jgi:uncharacterized protein YbaR (Trm112 family)
MPVKKELLEILACPACHGDIRYNEPLDALDCCKCRKRYPVKDGIPVMLIEESTTPEEGK